MADLPHLSPFELQCLRILSSLEEGTVREIHDRLDDPPTYSTVKKIVERLDAKGAVRRTGKREKAWVYAPTVSARAMVRKEVRRFLDALFDGAPARLVAHLADTDEISLDDLKEIEARMAARDKRKKKKGEEPMTEIGPVLRDLWLGVFRHLGQTTVIFLLLGAAALLVRRGPARILDRIGWIAVAKLLLPAALFAPGAVFLSGVLRIAERSELTLAVDPLRTIEGEIAGDGSGSALFAVWTLLYLAGAIYLTGRWVAGSRRPGRGAGATLDAADADIRRSVGAALGKGDVPALRLRILAGGGTPFVAGLLRPRIFLPEETVRRLDREELRSVLLHEAAHLRRMEPLRAFVLRAAVVLFYYYPPLWWLARRLRESSEMACDESAVRRGADPAGLADALAVTLHSEIAGGAAAWTGNGRSVIGRRLRRLQKRRWTVMKRHTFVFAVVVALFIGGLLIPAAGGARVVERPPVSMADGESVVVMPRIVKQVPPKYPKEAREAGVEGRVLLVARVNEEGSAEKAGIESEEPAGYGFADGAIEVLAEWEFEPGTVDGVPTAMEVKIPFDFRLSVDKNAKGEEKEVK